MIVRSRSTWFTKITIVINVVAYLWELETGALSSNPALINHGALYGVAVLNGQWWRIITGAYLHAGILHIGLNMIALYQVGRLVEMLLGSTRTALLYFISMIGSGLAVVVFTPLEPTIGASGAIFGLFGALVAIGLRLGERGRGLVGQVLPIIVINLIFGFSVPNISNAGHIGGLLSGFLVGLPVAYSVRLRRPSYAVPPPGTES